MGLYNYSVKRDSNIIVLDFSSLPVGKMVDLLRLTNPDATECTNWIPAMVSVSGALFQRFKDDVESVGHGGSFLVHVSPAGQLVAGLVSDVVYFLDCALSPS